VSGSSIVCRAGATQSAHSVYVSIIERNGYNCKEHYYVHAAVLAPDTRFLAGKGVSILRPLSRFLSIAHGWVGCSEPAQPEILKRQGLLRTGGQILDCHCALSKFIFAENGNIAGLPPGQLF
jgi:hypothetical protein